MIQKLNNSAFSKPVFKTGKLLNKIKKIYILRDTGKHPEEKQGRGLGRRGLVEKREGPRLFSSRELRRSLTSRWMERNKRVQRGAGLDGVSACRTLWFAPIYDLLVVSQEYGSHYSVVGKNLHGFWHHAFSAIRRRRFTGFSDCFTKEAPGTMVEIE